MLANAKRKSIEAMAAGKQAPAAANHQRAESSVLAAARAGRLRSNKGGAVAPDTLINAARSGRVFWVTA